MAKFPPLTDHEKYSTTWEKVSTGLIAILNDDLKALEKDQTEKYSTELRARIKLTRHILAASDNNAAA